MPRFCRPRPSLDHPKTSFALVLAVARNNITAGGSQKVLRFDE
jgi:hypothetical protein